MANTKPIDPKYSGASDSGDLYLDADDDSTWLWDGRWYLIAPADFYRASSGARH